MLIHVRQGKGARDRELPLTQKLLDALRHYWSSCKIKPRVYLLPSHWETTEEEKPISDKMLRREVPVGGEGLFVFGFAAIFRGGCLHVQVVWASWLSRPAQTCRVSAAAIECLPHPPHSGPQKRLFDPE